MSFCVGTEAYGRHVGRYGPALSAAHAEAAGVAAGDRALDVGCGPGVLLVELAQRLGGDRVAGVDPSQPFVASARAAVPAADVRVAAAERLPLESDSFDVALSQLVVNFMADARAGVAEMRRVARRTVTSCVWDYAREMMMLRAFWDAALELDPGAPDEGKTMRYCTPEELRSLWTDAGLRDVEAERWSSRPSTKTSTTTGHRSRPASRLPAPTALRSTRISRRRCARRVVCGSGRRKVGFR